MNRTEPGVHRLFWPLTSRQIFLFRLSSRSRCGFTGKCTDQHDDESTHMIHTTYLRTHTQMGKGDGVYSSVVAAFVIILRCNPKPLRHRQRSAAEASDGDLSRSRSALALFSAAFGFYYLRFSHTQHPAGIILVETKKNLFLLLHFARERDLCCRAAPSPTSLIQDPLLCWLCHKPHARMVYLESSVAAVFILGSAGCILDLLVLHQQQSAQLVFVACLLVICVLSTFALWSVKGRHACWHHGCGPGGITGGKQVAAAKAAQAPRSSCAGADDVLLGAAGTNDDEPPSEEFPLERRSSFVVSSVPHFAVRRCLRRCTYALSRQAAHMHLVRSQVEVAQRMGGHSFAAGARQAQPTKDGWVHRRCKTPFE